MASSPMMVKVAGKMVPMNLVGNLVAGIGRHWPGLMVVSKMAGKMWRVGRAGRQTVRSPGPTGV